MAFEERYASRFYVDWLYALLTWKMLFRHASAALANFMAANGFKVTKAYLGLPTAFRAEFQHGRGGRTLGVNSEMDALPGIGHACGHNLIAAAGVGIALAVKAALIKHNIAGKVVLLGTPGTFLATFDDL